MNHIEINNTDLATLLGILASRLRNNGLSLVGHAGQEYAPGNNEYRDLHELKASLNRTAALLDVIRDRLCPECRMVEVTEKVTIGKVAEDNKGGIRP